MYECESAQHPCIKWLAMPDVPQTMVLFLNKMLSASSVYGMHSSPGSFGSPSALHTFTHAFTHDFMHAFRCARMLRTHAPCHVRCEARFQARMHACTHIPMGPPCVDPPTLPICHIILSRFGQELTKEGCTLLLDWWALRFDRCLLAILRAGLRGRTPW